KVAFFDLLLSKRSFPCACSFSCFLLSACIILCQPQYCIPATGNVMQILPLPQKQLLPATPYLYTTAPTAAISHCRDCKARPANGYTSLRRKMGRCCLKVGIRHGEEATWLTCTSRDLYLPGRKVMASIWMMAALMPRR